MMLGATKTGEYRRTIEMLKGMAQEQHIYYLIAFLVDSQYDREDLEAMMKLLEPEIRNKKEQH